MNRNSFKLQKIPFIPLHQKDLHAGRTLRRLPQQKVVMGALVVVMMVIMLIIPSLSFDENTSLLDFSGPLEDDSDRFKILIFVSTSDELFPTRGEAVLRTWMDYANNKHPELNIRVVMALDKGTKYASRAKKSFPYMLVPRTSYEDLYIKILHALASVYEMYPNYDYYMKADDDLFIHIDRLAEQFRRRKHLLDPQNKYEWFGYNYDYMCWGGPGYIFSRQALHDLYPYLRTRCLKEYIGPEDVSVTECAKEMYQVKYKVTKTWPGCTRIPETDGTQFVHLHPSEDEAMWLTWNGTTSSTFRITFNRPEQGDYSFDKAITIHPIKQEQPHHFIPNMDQLYAHSSMARHF